MNSSPSPEAGCLIGIDMGGTAIKAAAFSHDGNRLASRIAPTSDGETVRDCPAWAVAVREILAGFESELGVRAGRVGISVPGLAARDRRSIASMPNRLAGIEGFDWSEWLGVPAPVLNDAHAALLGEAWQGAARNRRNVVMLTLGTGVGGAAMVDGRLLRGHLGRAGHLGHVTVDYAADEATIFGMTGGLEAAIGNYNVPSRSGGRFADTRALVEAAESGDADARAVWERSVRALGCAVGSFINAFDPEIVLIGGGIAEAADALWKPLREALDAVEWRPFGSGVPIVPAELGGWAGAFGAAWEAVSFSEDA